MSEFHHFGVPTSTVMEGSTYLEGAKVWITEPSDNPYRIEFLRFEADSPLPAAVRNQSHAAYLVDDLDAALEGEEVLIPPFDATPELRVAFISQDAAVIELMEQTG